MLSLKLKQRCFWDLPIHSSTGWLPWWRSRVPFSCCTLCSVLCVLAHRACWVTQKSANALPTFDWFDQTYAPAVVKWCLVCSDFQATRTFWREQSCLQISRVRICCNGLNTPIQYQQLHCGVGRAYHQSYCSILGNFFCIQISRM